MATTSRSEEGASTTTTEDLFAPVDEIGGPNRPATSTKAEYVAALEADLEEDDAADGGMGYEPGQAECLAKRWIGAITAERLRAAGIDAEDIDELDFAELDLGEAVGRRVVEGFDACGLDIVASVAEDLTSDLPPEDQACAVEEIDRDLVDAMLLAAFSGADDEEADSALDAVADQLRTACDLPED